jgi:dienelactone hydrolase
MSVDGLQDYARFRFTDGPYTREILRRGQGPGVIIIHEVPGIHPLVLRFAGRVADAGHTVFLPSLMGEPGRAPTGGHAAWQMVKAICIRREFSFWAADRSSPIVNWLRALARRVHVECGGPGVGAIGMCFSGGFALAMMTEPAVIAPVMSQPSLPLGFTRRSRTAIGMSSSEIDCVRRRFETENLSAIGLRFHGDPFVRPERFATYKACFGEAFESIEIDPRDAQPGGGMKPHAVLTISLRDDDPGGATKRAEARVIQFFKQRLQDESLTRRPS